MPKQPESALPPLNQYQKDLLDEGGLTDENSLSTIGCWKCRQRFHRKTLWLMKKTGNGMRATICPSCGKKLLQRGWEIIKKIKYNYKMKFYSIEDLLVR